MRTNPTDKFCPAKETIKKRDNLQNIVSNDATNKGLIPKTYKQFIQLNSKKATTQSKMGRRPE